MVVFFYDVLSSMLNAKLVSNSVVALACRNSH